jgi:hypothetical protein
VDRQLGDDENAWIADCGTVVEIRFKEVCSINGLRLTLDSNLRSTKRMPCTVGMPSRECRVPEQLIKSFVIQAQQADGSWQDVYTETNNYQRLLRVPVSGSYNALRFIPQETWGDDKARVFALDVV